MVHKTREPLKRSIPLVEVVPGEHTGRVVHGMTHWPDTDTLTLPSCAWLDITFARNLWGEKMAARWVFVYLLRPTSSPLTESKSILPRGVSKPSGKSLSPGRLVSTGGSGSGSGAATGRGSPGSPYRSGPPSLVEE
jgi:hypothetical protein